jgi:hypothetical protein
MTAHAKLAAVRWSIAAVMLASSALGCVPRSRMCTATSECSDKSACVAGRCQLEKASVKPAVDSARRLVVRPVDIAYLRSGDGPSGGALPPLFALGAGGGKLFLRFAAVVPSTANVIEAYVVLRRSRLVDDEPTPISLHATRIVDPWKGGSISWARQPRSTETRSPTTTVEPSGSSIVRLDVRELVRQWARHDPSDQGIAIVAENETRTGTTFALTGIGAIGAENASADFGSAAGRMGPSASGAAPDVEPFLELYVR